MHVSHLHGRMNETFLLPAGFRDEMRAFHLTCNRAAVLTFTHYCNVALPHKDPLSFLACADSAAVHHGATVPLASWAQDVTSLFEDPSAPFVAVQLSPKKVDHYMLEVTPRGDLTIRLFAVRGTALVFCGLRTLVARSLESPALPLWTSAQLDVDTLVRVVRTIRFNVEVEFPSLIWLSTKLRSKILVPLSVAGQFSDVDANKKEITRLDFEREVHKRRTLAENAHAYAPEMCANALADVEAVEVEFGVRKSARR